MLSGLLSLRWFHRLFTISFQSTSGASWLLWLANKEPRRCKPNVSLFSQIGG